MPAWSSLWLGSLFVYWCLHSWYLSASTSGKFLLYVRKTEKCLQENSDSRTDQCARCPKNCIKCSGPRLAQCQEFDDSARSRNRDDDEDCQTSSGSLLTTGSVFGLVLSLATLLVVLFNSGLISKLTGIKFGSENVASSWPIFCSSTYDVISERIMFSYDVIKV